MHKKEEIAHPGSQISLKIDLTFIVNFEHSSQMDLSHTCPQIGLNPAKAGLEAIFKIYHLVIFQPKKEGAPGVVFEFFLGICICICIMLVFVFAGKGVPGGGNVKTGVQAKHWGRRPILGLSGSSHKQGWQESRGYLGDQSAL